ncbi:MAG: preprotein translocase subunit YajC [Dehalococcoidia bacterium]|nr:preprotein translocase subunit YajC [Dehalococcoidia bacterium]
MDVLLMLIAVLAAFYFILMRPVIVQQKRRRSDISQLQVGDEVLTTGGFYATVKEIQTTDEGPMQIYLEAAPGVVLRATPAAVELVSRRAAEEQPAPAASGDA